MTTKEKPLVGTQKFMIKRLKHTTTTKKNPHITKEDSKRESKEQMSYKTVRKQYQNGSRTFLPTNNYFEVNVLKSTIKRHRMA